MGRPKPPDPMQVSRQQQTFNRESQADAAQHGQIGQDTPYGSISYTGEIGSPDRRQTVTLNPQDQARLEQERSIKSRLLGVILGGAQGMGGGGGGQGMPSEGKQGGGQPMPAMSIGMGQGGPPPDPQQVQQVQQAQQQMQPMMENPPFGLSGGGPHGPPGQPSMEEMLANAGMPKGMVNPYMKWK